MSDNEQFEKKPWYSGWPNWVLVPGWIALLAGPILLVWQVAKYLITGVWINLNLATAFSFFKINPLILIDSTRSFGKFTAIAYFITVTVPLSVWIIVAGVMWIVLFDRFVKK